MRLRVDSHVGSRMHARPGHAQLVLPAPQRNLVMSCMLFLNVQRGGVRAAQLLHSCWLKDAGRCHYAPRTPATLPLLLAVLM